MEQELLGNIDVVDFDSFTETERRKVGCWVVSIAFMSKLSKSITEKNIVFSDINACARTYLRILDEDGYDAARKSLVGVQAPDSPLFTARKQMLLATSHKDRYGNHLVVPNKTFIAATHYLDDDRVRNYADRTHGISDIYASDLRQMTTFYSDRADRILDESRDSTDLRELVASSHREIEFYLQAD